MRAGHRINIEKHQVENALVWGKNGVTVSVKGVAGSGEDILLHARDRSVLGLVEPPPYGVTRECPSSTKTPAGHQKSTWVM